MGNLENEAVVMGGSRLLMELSVGERKRVDALIVPDIEGRDVHTEVVGAAVTYLANGQPKQISVKDRWFFAS